MKKLFIVLALTSSICLAEVGTDKFAHAGVSYALNMTFYGIFKKGMQLDNDQKFEALILSIPLVLMMGAVKEVLDCDQASYYRNGKCTFDFGDMGANLIGIGLSSASIFIFDF